MQQDKTGVKSDNQGISKTTEQTDLQTEMTETTMTTSSATPDIGPLVQTRNVNGIYEGNKVKMLYSDSPSVSRKIGDLTEYLHKHCL